MANDTGGNEDERDEAWLLARARGEATEHPDPKRAAEYERLEGALAVLPPDLERERAACARVTPPNCLHTFFRGFRGVNGGGDSDSGRDHRTPTGCSSHNIVLLLLERLMAVSTTLLEKRSVVCGRSSLRIMAALLKVLGCGLLP